MSDFIVAARSMLLPIDPAEEAACHQELRALLSLMGVAPDDQASWINIELRQWRSSIAGASPELRQVIMTGLFFADRTPPTFMFTRASAANDPHWNEIAEKFAAQYFALHKRLVSGSLLSHDAARQVLAQSGLIARLAYIERMSASEISRVLAARNADLAAQWPAIAMILRGMGLAPEMSRTFVDAQFTRDAEQEPGLFGDLNLVGCIDRVGSVALGLGCGPVFETALRDILLTDRHDPYLLILHYQMTILARYDHAVSFAYEFSPRGQAVDWLTEQYQHAGIPVMRNAYLNNAKALLRFDRAWAVTRSDHPRGAAALVNILSVVETLGPLAKAELAFWVRGLLSRHIRLSRQMVAGIPGQLAGWGRRELEVVFGAIATANSGTTGIAEQRLVDCYALARHPEADGWVSRGVGDSVFAPNVPRRKCGDCEFERANADQPEITAYEAHGGHLSRIYVDDHLQSLSQVLSLRAEDLAALAPLDQWNIEVTFVAHSFGPNLPTARTIQTPKGDAAVELRYATFGEVAAVVGQADTELLQHAFVAPINNPNVHPRVRERLLHFVHG